MFLDGVAVLQIPMERFGFDFATKDLVDITRKHNIAVYYWTINNEEDIIHLTENGADCIMTDYPLMAYETVNSLK